MSKFSPGPWRVLSDGTVWTDEPTPHPMGPLQPHGHSICKLTEQRTLMGVYFERGNARLIAAAPEMYQLICKILDDEEITEGRLRRMRQIYARIDGDSDE